MKLIIKLFGILIILMGISFLLNPEGVYNWAEENTGNIMFYISVIIARLVLGISLILAAKESKYPGAIKFFGYLMIIAALIVIIMGHKGFQDLISSLVPVFKPYAPMSGLIGIALGVFFIYAFSEKKLETELVDEN